MQVLKTAYKHLKFQTKVMTLTSLLILVIFIALSFYIQSIIAQNIEDEVGEKALAVATTLAKNSELIDAFDLDKPEEVIQPWANSIQEDIDAEFVVVGNKDEIRYSHALDNRLGKKMVGDDNDRALKNGEAYISKKKGSLGLSIRGKAPIVKNEEIIGVISVGYLLADVNELVQDKNQPIIILFIIFLVVGIIASIFIAKHLKGLLFNMEPYEIAESLLQKEAILQSTKEGIIAVDSNNKISLINESAKQILQIENIRDDKILKQDLAKFVDIPIRAYAQQDDHIVDREFILNHDIIFMNSFLLKEGNDLYGAVATFRRKTDLEEVTNELSTIKQYADGLRAQAHEFSNKMHTISGLLQLDHIKEAKKFIRQDYQTYTTQHDIITTAIKEPSIQALLIAKYNQASEKGIELELYPESQLDKLPSIKQRDVLLKVLGNLIDNAFFIVGEDPKISLLITDIGKEIIIEIDDNGPGIAVIDEKRIFEDGFSTKKENGHGTGLYIVKKAVTLLKGEIFLETSELGGACFVIMIPKEINNEDV